jgi:hypothetical protein
MEMTIQDLEMESTLSDSSLCLSSTRPSSASGSGQDGSRGEIAEWQGLLITRFRYKFDVVVIIVLHWILLN